MSRAIFNHQTGLTALAITALIATAIVRFTVDDVPGVMLLGVVPITLLGVMYGVWAGLGAASFSAITFEIWAISDERPQALEMIDVPVTFFVLGLLSGSFARGALGDFNLRRAAHRAELRHAIRRGELALHYQPIIDARTGRTRGVEALVRWKHPNRGLLPPAEFVPLAEGHPPTIALLAREVADIATRELAPLLEGAGAGLSIGINLTATNLTQEPVLAHLRERFAAHDIPIEQLQLEVTENDLIRDPAAAARALAELKREGASVALDDFGTGRSALAELSELPADTLKIDRNLREQVPGSLNGIVAPLITLAHHIGMVVVAEQIEAEEVRDELLRLGVDALQGYLISEPLPIGELAEWLEGQATSSRSAG